MKGYKLNKLDKNKQRDINRGNLLCGYSNKATAKRERERDKEREME